MNNIILKGICLSKHSDGRETITKDAYALIDMLNRKIYVATPQSKSCSANSFIIEDENIKYSFNVDGEFGSYFGVRNCVMRKVPTTVWGESVFVSEYTTTIGSEGRIIYTENYSFKSSYCAQNVSETTFDELERIFSTQNRIYNPMISSPFAYQQQNFDNVRAGGVNHD